MYDSSRTKLLKNIFDSKETIDNFINIATKLQGELNLEKMYVAQLEKVYIQYKKIFRDHFFKPFCKDYNILIDKGGINSEDPVIVDILTKSILKGIELFAHNFMNNRKELEKDQKTLKSICYASAENCMNSITSQPLLLNLKNKIITVISNDALISENC
jgi:hypothetical protein